MAGTALLDSQLRPIALGREIAKGGEGAVHEVVGHPNLVAKRYLKPPPHEHAGKLAAMAAMAQEPLLKIAAWPTDTLHDPAGQLVGFTMPKVSGSRAAFELYSPKLRLQKFPKADWRFLVHAATNVARAFAVIHAAGHVVGDVNERNLAVTEDGKVHVFDCDSFQITQGRQRWLCDVGVDTHQPPEMQGLTSYRGVVRSANHDLFGLAVLLFRMLCIARHPFAGVSSAQGEAPSVSEAIKAYRYAYAHDRQRTAMSPPPGSLPVEALGDRVRNLFEQAFSPSGSRPGGRPTADQWAVALSALGGELKQCRANLGHHHLSSLAECPWCRIEAVSGRALFPLVFVGGAQSVSIAALWQQVLDTPDPGSLATLPAFSTGQATPSAEAKAFGQRVRTRRKLASAAAVIGVLLPFILQSSLGIGLCFVLVALALLLGFKPPGGAGAIRFRTALADASKRLVDLQRMSGIPTGRPTFAEVRQTIYDAKRSYDDLPNERARRFERLRQTLRQSQLEEHLDRFPLRDAKINGIGKGRVATLLSYGMETAADLDPSKLAPLQGFGPATIASLMAWKQTCAQSFRFDPSRDVAPSDVAALERDVLVRRHALEQEIRQKGAELIAVAARTRASRAAFEGEWAQHVTVYQQAHVDVLAARLRG